MRFQDAFLALLYYRRTGSKRHFDRAVTDALQAGGHSPRSDDLAYLQRLLHNRLTSFGIIESAFCDGTSRWSVATESALLKPDGSAILIGPPDFIGAMKSYVSDGQWAHRVLFGIPSRIGVSGHFSVSQVRTDRTTLLTAATACGAEIHYPKSLALHSLLPSVTAVLATSSETMERVVLDSESCEIFNFDRSRWERCEGLESFSSHYVRVAGDYGFRREFVFAGATDENRAYELTCSDWGPTMARALLGRHFYWRYDRSMEELQIPTSDLRQLPTLFRRALLFAELRWPEFGRGCYQIHGVTDDCLRSIRQLLAVVRVQYA